MWFPLGPVIFSFTIVCVYATSICAHMCASLHSSTETQSVCRGQSYRVDFSGHSRGESNVYFFLSFHFFLYTHTMQAVSLQQQAPYVMLALCTDLTGILVTFNIFTTVHFWHRMVYSLYFVKVKISNCQGYLFRGCLKIIGLGTTRFRNCMLYIFIKNSPSSMNIF